MLGDKGGWVGKADPEDYPAHMEIDWVRIYQQERPERETRLKDP